MGFTSMKKAVHIMAESNYRIRYEELKLLFDELSAGYETVLIENGKLIAENDMFRKLISTKIGDCPLFREESF